MKAKPEETNTEDQHAGDRAKALIGESLMRVLGKPGDLRAVMVKRLWGDHYRVNVLTGVDITSATIAHSYFLTADGSGNILTASPVLTNHYGPA